MIERLALRLGYFAREWLAGIVSLLPNDSVSCKIRRWTYLFLGVDVRKGVLIYRNVLLLGKIEIGQHSSISNNTSINGASAGVYIGENVMIAPGCCLVAFNHGTKVGVGPMIDQPLDENKIVIHDDVWIGANCTITSGVTIASGAVIAANSVVVRDVGAFEVIGGVPARLIKKRGEICGSS